MKARYNAKHHPVQYKLGDRVLLKLQPHRQLRLSSKWYTLNFHPVIMVLFPILAKLGFMA
jgi:hypothetical protein